VVDLLGLNPVQQLDQVGRVGDVAVVREQADAVDADAVDVRVLVKPVDAAGVERGSAPDIPWTSYPLARSSSAR